MIACANNGETRGERFIQVKRRTFLSITQGSLSWEGKTLIRHAGLVQFKSVWAALSQGPGTHMYVVKGGYLAKGWPGPWGLIRDGEATRLFPLSPIMHLPPHPAQAWREINTRPLLSPQCCPAEAIRGSSRGSRQARKGEEGKETSREFLAQPPKRILRCGFALKSIVLTS